MQQGDGPLRIVRHQQVELFLVKQILLVFKGLEDPEDEVVEMLQAKGGGDQLAKKYLGQPLHRRPDLQLLIEAAEFFQNIFFTDLGDDDRQVVLVDISVKGVNDILDPLGHPPEDIEILGIGEAPHFQRGLKQGQVGGKTP
ncbi:MAG: hypothetical protein ACD_75C00557G0001 [uncultured bacterium]|nr:MAG: hypothetical protein ACD_75C00557G0001 [uncultured bacterium]